MTLAVAGHLTDRDIEKLQEELWRETWQEYGYGGLDDYEGRFGFSAT